MPHSALRNYFFAASALQGHRVKLSKKELVIIAALDIFGTLQQGQRLYSLHRFCEKNHHCWDYRNFKKIMDGLIKMPIPYVRKIGICYQLTIEGILLVGQLNRRLEKLSGTT